MQNKSVTPTPEYEAILDDLRFALATRGTYQQHLLPFIRELLEWWQDPDVSTADIEQTVQDWQADEYPKCSAEEGQDGEEGDASFLDVFGSQIVDMCLKLHEHPFEMVQAVLDDQCSKLAQAKRDENTLAVLEESARAVYDNLDDRTRYIVGALVHLKGRFNDIEYWDDIYNQLADPEFLEEKAADFAEDPQIGTLVKAFRMGEIVSAAHM